MEQNKQKKIKNSDIKLKSKKLPEKMIFLPNQDKTWHEEWYDKRSLLNIPHPARISLCGKPNVGKSATIQNLILRADPMFQDIFVIHGDYSNTKEYNWLGKDDDKVKMMGHIPEPKDFPGLVKTLVIIDDLELKTLPKQQQMCLDRLFGYVSTHKNISVYIGIQDFFHLPTIVRRCCNVVILWKGHDLSSLSRTANKCGLKPDELNALFDTYCSGYRDSIWLDLTNGTPAPIRVNGFDVVEKITPTK
tara:strand:+ start:304 stop:1044 length:741 start_codon:yes stop_codon:yes gene_type:complete